MNEQLIGLVAAGFLACACAALGQDFPKPRPGGEPPLPKPAAKPPRSGNQLVQVKAMADVQHIVPGQSFHLALIFEIEPHWHIYWKNPGSAGGGPTHINITAPANFAVGTTRFPRPLKIEAEDGMSYGYENKTVLFVEVTAPPQFMVDQVTFSATANWMVCKDVCLLGRSTHMITLPAGAAPSGRPLSQAQIDPAVTEFKAQLPRPLSELEGAQATFDGTTLSISLPDSGYTTAEFFPLEMPGVECGESTITHDDASDTITISVPVRVNRHNALGKPLTISGTVGLGTRQSDPSYDIEIALPAP